MKQITVRIWCQAFCLVVMASLRGSGVAQTPPPARAAAAGHGARRGSGTAAHSGSNQLFDRPGLRRTDARHRASATRVTVDGPSTRGLKDGLQGKEAHPGRSAASAGVSCARRGSAAVARNQTAAKEFLARNAQEKGVVTTASGLQYKVLDAGDKKAPADRAHRQVTVHYRGKLIDGTEFDSSYARGVPATFPVNGVIKGWQEALVLMKPGAKWQLFMPPELAYGVRARSRKFPAARC